MCYAALGDNAEFLVDAGGFTCSSVAAGDGDHWRSAGDARDGELLGQLLVAQADCDRSAQYKGPGVDRGGAGRGDASYLPRFVYRQFECGVQAHRRSQILLVTPKQNYISTNLDQTQYNPGNPYLVSRRCWRFMAGRGRRVINHR